MDQQKRPRERDADAGTFAEGTKQQAELEKLIEEKGDFQAGVDAQRRGEKPEDESNAANG